jgi:hypothetical protein
MGSGQSFLAVFVVIKGFCSEFVRSPRSITDLHSSQLDVSLDLESGNVIWIRAMSVGSKQLVVHVDL